MGISPLSFTGINEFSDDFQTILDRSVAIAGIPLEEMLTEQTDLLMKKQLLTDLRSVVAGLASAVSGLGSIGENRALGASSSDTGNVTVTLNGATQAGTYTISDITSIATAAISLASRGLHGSKTGTLAKRAINRESCSVCDE